MLLCDMSLPEFVARTLLRVGLLAGGVNHILLQRRFTDVTDCFPVISQTPFFSRETEMTLANFFFFYFGRQMPTNMNTLEFSLIFLLTCCIIAILHSRLSYNVIISTSY